MQSARTVAVRPPVLLAVLLIVSTLLRLLAARQLDLGQDEVYVLTVTRTFQLSFFDHPPLAFWTSWAMQALFGRDLSPLLLRLPFVVMFTGTLWAGYALTARFYGARAGLWAAGLLSVTPFFAASAGGWVMPDGPLMLFLMLAALCFARALYEPPDGHGHWPGWLAAGLFLGLALLSKYQAFLVLPGVGLLLLAPSHRRWLARPQPYVALALATLVMAPVLAWNMQHGWISFRFQLGRAVGAPGLGWPWIRMVLIESLYLWPWLAAAMLVAAVLAVKRRLRHCGLFLALGLPAILLFNLQPMIGHAGQPHWAMAGWLFFYPLLGEAMATAREGGRRWPVWLAAPSAALFAVLVVALLALPLYFPWLARIRGMDEFARESLAWNGVAAALRADDLLDRPGTFLAATNWRQASSLGAAVRGDRPVVPFTSDPRGLAFLDTPARHMGEDAVFAVAPREVAATEAMARRHFASVSRLATVETSYGGAPAFETVILIAHRLEKPYPLPYGLPDP